MKTHIADKIDLIFGMPCVRASESTMRETFAMLRERGTLSSANDEIHVMAVAKYGAVIAYAITEALGMRQELCDRIAYMTTLAGLWHDMTCEAPEKVGTAHFQPVGFLKLIIGN